MRIELPMVPPVLSRAASDEFQRPGVMLSEGQVVEALVLEEGPGGRFLVDLGGWRTWARCTVALETGQRVRLLVAQLGPEIMLRVVGSEEISGWGVLAARLRLALPWMTWEALGELLDHAMKELGRAERAWQGDPKIPYELVVAAHHLDLRWMLRASGLLLEAKLGRMALGENQPLWPDLKGRLLQLLTRGEDRGGAAGPWKYLVHLIEGSQAISSMARDRGELQILLPIPPWWMPRGSWGELRLRGDPFQGGKARRNRWFLTLRLELEDLGRIMARLYLGERALRCELWASDSRMRVLMEEELAGLQARLLKLGLSRVDCAVGLLEEEQQWEEMMSEVPGCLMGIVA